MPHADLVIHNIGQLVTCAAGGKPKRGAEMLDPGIIENGAVAIRHDRSVPDGKIVAVGTSASVLGEYGDAEQINARRQVVTPGFVDPHTHIVYAGNRLNEFELKLKGAEYLDILAAGGGIVSTVKQTRAQFSDSLVVDGNSRLSKMLACGTTLCEIKTGYGLDVETELKMLRVIFEMAQMHKVEVVPTVLAAHAVPPEFAGDTVGYVELVCNEILPRAMEYYSSSTHFPNEGVPIFADVFCERNAFDLAQMERVLTAAGSLGFKLKAHVDQFTNLGGSRLAIKLGATSIDHLDTISDEEIALLAASETVGVVIPTENFSAGKTQFANARKVIDEGCAIALSTDYNPGSAPCPSMPMAMAIACRYQKLLPSEAMNAATINASAALGMAKSHGSIEEGKTADLVIWETDDYRSIAYEFGGNQVRTVLKSGEIVYERDRY
nr:imidazolonepropionase [uncultured bacterium]